MKRFSILLGSLLIFILGCSHTRSTDCECFSDSKYSYTHSTENDQSKEESIKKVIVENQKIDKIKINGAFDVTIVQGGKNQVSIESSPEELDKVKCTYKNGVVEIEQDGFVKRPLSVYRKISVEVSSIENLEFRGACNIVISDFKLNDDFRIKLYGASKMKMNKLISTSSAKLEVSGACYFDIPRIEVAEIEMDLDGVFAGEIGMLKANKSRIEIDGVSRLKVAGSVGDLEVEVNGMSGLDARELDFVNLRAFEVAGLSFAKLGQKE